MTANKKEHVYIDIMHGDTHIGQLEYKIPGKKIVIDGKSVPVYNLKDIEEFVYSKRPSLRGQTDVRIYFSNQKV